MNARADPQLAPVGVRRANPRAQHESPLRVGVDDPQFGGIAVDRQTAGGRGHRIFLTGHHEIMFPLLVAAVREELSRRSR